MLLQNLLQIPKKNHISAGYFTMPFGHPCAAGSYARLSSNCYVCKQMDFKLKQKNCVMSSACYYHRNITNTYVQMLPPVLVICLVKGCTLLWKQNC